MSAAADALLLEVFREQRPSLWGFLVRGSGSKEIAEDLLQECFLRTWSHRERLTAESEAADRDSLRRYVWRVARNLMIDEIRVRQRHRPHESDVEPHMEPVATNPGPAEALELEESVRVVRETVARLPNPRGRRCLRLWLDGMDLTAIANETGMAPGQVRGLLQRGRAEVILRAIDRLRAGPRFGGER